MPIAAAARGPWLFWDGRKDSLWSQALGPLEDAAEHGTNRVQAVRVLATHYRADYERLFGSLPSLQGMPADASPLGSPQERAAWAGMTDAQRDAVNRAFANLGKAIAAYERTVSHGESRFDRYAAAVLKGDAEGQQVLTAQERRGLRLFIGQGQCATCHHGPLFTDDHFHNTGVPQRDASRPDRGRGVAVASVLDDEFNCLGRYSDASRDGCAELRFIAADDPRMEGAFKTPGLRNVAERAPYMHAGQFASLEEVVAHYVRSPAATVGQSELARAGGGDGGRSPIRLTDEEARDLVAFLKALSDSPTPEHEPARALPGPHQP
jgi:cytochrome c peroxidase